MLHWLKLVKFEKLSLKCNVSNSWYTNRLILTWGRLPLKIVFAVKSEWSWLPAWYPSMCLYFCYWAGKLIVSILVYVCSDWLKPLKIYHLQNKNQLFSLLHLGKLCNLVRNVQIRSIYMFKGKGSRCNFYHGNHKFSCWREISTSMSDYWVGGNGLINH